MHAPAVVDNRTFLLGLDELYRTAMKRHESSELLVAARRVAAVLDVPPATGPVEGYYLEDRRLTEYFQLMRALREVDESAAPKVAGVPEFQGLRAVAASPIFGRAEYAGKLLPHGTDALSQALLATRPVWTIEGLTAAAQAVSHATDDFSLVGLAARIQDPVVLAALRESVVLYSQRITLGRKLHRPRYSWQVDAHLAEQARRFIDGFNVLFDEHLPLPEPSEAERFWSACEDNDIIGRCVCIGIDDTVSPPRHYHWGIRDSREGDLSVHEFWDTELWTTERHLTSMYR